MKKTSCLLIISILNAPLKRVNCKSKGSTLKLAGRNNVEVDAVKVMQTSASNVCLALCHVALPSVGYSSAVLVSNHPAMDPSTLRDTEKDT